MKRKEILKLRLDVSEEISKGIQAHLKKGAGLRDVPRFDTDLADYKLQRLLEEYKKRKKRTSNNHGLRELSYKFFGYEEYLMQRLEMEDEHELWKEFYDIQEFMPIQSSEKSMRLLIDVSIQLFEAILNGEIKKEHAFMPESMLEHIIWNDVEAAKTEMYEELMVVDTHSDTSLQNIKYIKQELEMLQKKYMEKPTKSIVDNNWDDLLKLYKDVANAKREGAVKESLEILQYLLETYDGKAMQKIARVYQSLADFFLRYDYIDAGIKEIHVIRKLKTGKPEHVKETKKALETYLEEL